MTMQAVRRSNLVGCSLKELMEETSMRDVRQVFHQKDINTEAYLFTGILAYRKNP
ncbi:MAG: hypothetical protein LBC19_02170 [Tannerella sp.]|nr:hypothetical protein [Tannerella sp.]